MGPKQEDWLRLFMVPGMAHCGGGPGPNQVNWMAAMERWREYRNRTRSIDRITSQRQPRKHDTTGLSLSTSRAVHRRGQHEQRGELRLQGPVNVSPAYEALTGFAANSGWWHSEPLRLKPDVTNDKPRSEAR